MRRRRVSPIVLTGQVDLPPSPKHRQADWARELWGQPGVEAGDVEQLPLAHARMRWPGFRGSVTAVSDWLAVQGLPDVVGPATSHGDLALMACCGARYHHDGSQYGAKVFCNLFVSDTPELVVHFPAIGKRIALLRGTVMVFDTCQPHGVVFKDRAGFDAADFATRPDCVAAFLTWELPVDTLAVSRALQIGWYPDDHVVEPPMEEGLMRYGALAQVCPQTGAWR